MARSGNAAISVDPIYRQFTNDYVKRLDTFLHSDKGYEFVGQLSEQQLNIKRRALEERLNNSPTIRSLSHDDAQLVMGMRMKYYNQRGGNSANLLRSLDNRTMSVQDVIDFIQTDSRSASNISAVLTRRDNTLKGVRLMNRLDHSENILGQLWWETTESNPSLSKEFSSDPKAQIFNQMFRNPAVGNALLNALDGHRAYAIRTNNRTQEEAYTVGVTQNGILYSIDKNGRGHSLTADGQWKELNSIQELDRAQHSYTSPITSSLETIQTVEALHEKLQANVGKQIEAAGKGRFADSMVAECTYQCIKKDITAENINQMFVDTNHNRIFIDTKLDGKIAVIDAFEAAKVDPTERLQAALQTQEEKVQQQTQEQNLQLAQQQERSGPKMG